MVGVFENKRFLFLFLLRIIEPPQFVIIKSIWLQPMEPYTSIIRQSRKIKRPPTGFWKLETTTTTFQQNSAFRFLPIKNLSTIEEVMREVFFRIVTIIKFLAGSDVFILIDSLYMYWNAFEVMRILILSINRSSASISWSFKENISTKNGNFLKLVESVAEFDPVLRTHVHKIGEEGSRTHYLSAQIQNELISIISSSITERIIQMTKDRLIFQS